MKYFCEEIQPEHVSLIKNFHKTLMLNRGNLVDKNVSYDPTQIPIGVTNDSISVGEIIADIFYMPKGKFGQFHFLSDLFNRKRIFLGKLFFDINLIADEFVIKKNFKQNWQFQQLLEEWLSILK